MKPLIIYKLAKTNFKDPWQDGASEEVVERVQKTDGSSYTKVYYKKELLGKGGFANCF
jgi:polo-like kinase 1